MWVTHFLDFGETAQSCREEFKYEARRGVSKRYEKQENHE